MCLTRAAPRAASASAPNPPVALTTIRNRRDFLAASAQGKKIVTGTFVLQKTRRPKEHPVSEKARIGFTVTRKMGNAVKRNRIKRRLREAVKRVAPTFAESGCDYVVIARTKALACDFSELVRDMEFAFSRINANKKPS